MVRQVHVWYRPTDEEYQKFIKTCRAGLQRAIIQNDLKAAVKYLYALFVAVTGLRRSEVKTIRLIDDIDYIKHTLRVVRKKKRKTIITRLPLPDWFVDDIRCFINKFVYRVNPNEVFKDLPDSTITYWFRDICREAGIKEYSPHAFRHYIATKLIEKTRDLDYVRRWLGHETYDVVRQYLDRDIILDAVTKDVVEFFNKLTKT